MLIDCARMMEKHDFYFNLLDFMHNWNYDTLLFHFSDDQGLAVELPGFEDIAMTNAFTVEEINRLQQKATSLGISIIPELETFGHTRFLTGQPKFKHLFAGGEESWGFYAIDPVNPETHQLIERLIQSTCQLFQSEYLHIGCDEADIKDFCELRNLDETETWARYVNRVIEMAKSNDKKVMMWGDHPTKSDKIAEQLRKDVLLVDWRYDPDVKEDVCTKLNSYGFDGLIAAPSVACTKMRFHTTDDGYVNTRRMINFAHRHNYEGVINTVWCPYRYYQDAIYAPLAYSSQLHSNPKRIPENFYERFINKTIGIEASPKCVEFMKRQPHVHLNRFMSMKIMGEDIGEYESLALQQAQKTVTIGEELLDLLDYPDDNPIIQGMILGVRASWLCAEYLLLSEGNIHRKRIDKYYKVLTETRELTAEYWHIGRFQYSPPEGSQSHQHLLNLLNQINNRKL